MQKIILRGNTVFKRSELHLPNKGQLIFLNQKILWWTKR